MTQHASFKATVLTVFAASTLPLAYAGSDEAAGSLAQRIAGDRTVLGVVETIGSDQARIGTNKGQPRFVPMNVRKEKDLAALKKGDLVEITVNDQNLLVDVHLQGELDQHRVVAGHLARPVDTGHDQAVIRTRTDTEESHRVSPSTRSKVASIPVGADVLFLLDERGEIVDVTFGNVEAVIHSLALGQRKSPLKGNLSQVDGVIATALLHNSIVIRLVSGHEQAYEARPSIQARLGTLVKGDAATLLVDADNKVTDVAFVPHGQR
jgi:hypothetical protein